MNDSKKRSEGRDGRFKTVYVGRSQDEADRACADFWSGVKPEEKLAAVTAATREAYALKGIDFDALRLDRTTAVIRKA